MLGCETLQANREFDVAGANDVLDLEVGELRVEAELLDNTRVLAGRKLGVILALGTRNDHLSACENQGRRLRLPNAHDDGSETLIQVSEWTRESSDCARTNLWVVFGVTSMQSNRLQVEANLEVDCSDDVPLREAKSDQQTAQRVGLKAQQVYSTACTHCKVGVNPEPLCTTAGVAGVTPVPLFAV